jgi:hypothetical protein
MEELKDQRKRIERIGSAFYAKQRVVQDLVDIYIELSN